MRNKIGKLFEYRLADDESITNYLRRMDSMGQLDQMKIIKLIGFMLDEIERLALAE